MFDRSEQFNEAIEAAKRANTGKRYGLAVLHQEKAVALLRGLGPANQNKELASRLAVELYNLATYQQHAGNLEAAVTAMSEVVSIDAEFNLADQSSDATRLNEVRFMLMTATAEKAERAVNQENFDAAIEHQNVVVTTLRNMYDTEPHNKILEELGIHLFHLAEMHGHLQQYNESVAYLEEVVVIDKALDLPDLETDLQALEDAKFLQDIANDPLGQQILEQINALAPDEQAMLQQDFSDFADATEALPQEEQDMLTQMLGNMAIQMANMSPDEQQAFMDQVEGMIDEMPDFDEFDEEAQEAYILSMAQLTEGFNELSPEEQLARLQEVRIDLLLGEVVEEFWLWRDGEFEEEEIPELIQALMELAVEIGEDEALGPQSQPLAQFITAVASYIKGDKNPPIPLAFQKDWQEFLTGPSDE